MSFSRRFHDVRNTLSLFPLDELNSIDDTRDRQIFGLEQRAVGEALIVATGNRPNCMRYSEFMQKWHDPTFLKTQEPLIAFLEGSDPHLMRPWTRLTLMSKALEELEKACRQQLSLDPKKTFSNLPARARPAL